MTEKTQYFNGYRFTRGAEGTYYRSAKLKKRMHRYVWEYYNGEIPDGYEVHHIDFDKSNNDISNLQLLTRSEHRKLHADLLTVEEREWRKNNLNNNARKKAIEWHKSKEGREWHKLQYEKTKDKLHKKIELVCLNCNKTFVGSNNSKFCSKACASSHRRKSGVDDITKICPICNNKFRTNKYKDSITCSRSCANKYRRVRRNEGKENSKD